MDATRLWQLNLRHLQAAAAIVRTGSVTAAARALPLSQPAVTQALARLEALLGQPLFARAPGGMIPTEAVLLLAPRIEAAAAHLGSPRITMAGLRAALALAEAGSYVGAAAATGLTEPTLHRAVKDLGVATRRTLIERRGRGIGFTRDGRMLVRRLRLARGELLTALTELDALAGLETGRIAIGAMPLARARLLPAAVAAFNREHPDIAIAIAEGAYAELVEPLRDGELDMLVGAVRAEPPPDLEQVALFHDRPIVLARAGHPLSGKPADLTAMTRYDWIVPAPGTPLRAQWTRMFADAGLSPPRVPIESGSVMLIRQLLLASDCLTLLSPDQVTVELEAGWLARIADAPASLVRVIGVTTRAGWRPTRLQARFLDALRAAGISNDTERGQTLAN